LAKFLSPLRSKKFFFLSHSETFIANVAVGIDVVFVVVVIFSAAVVVKVFAVVVAADIILAVVLVIVVVAAVEVLMLWLLFRLPLCISIHLIDQSTGIFLIKLA